MSRQPDCNLEVAPQKDFRWGSELKVLFHSFADVTVLYNQAKGSCGWQTDMPATKPFLHLLHVTDPCKLGRCWVNVAMSSNGGVEKVEWTYRGAMLAMLGGLQKGGELSMAWPGTKNELPWTSVLDGMAEKYNGNLKTLLLLQDKRVADLVRTSSRHDGVFPPGVQVPRSMLEQFPEEVEDPDAVRILEHRLRMCPRIFAGPNLKWGGKRLPLFRDQDRGAEEVAELEEQRATHGRLVWAAIRIWAWSKLVKVWASLRWSDLQAIIPAELVLVEGRLVTTLRWTKTSEELPVAISEHAFILGRDWQKVGFNLLKAHAGYKRDYLMSCWDPGSAARGADRCERLDEREIAADLVPVVIIRQVNRDDASRQREFVTKRQWERRGVHRASSPSSSTDAGSVLDRWSNSAGGRPSPLKPDRYPDGPAMETESDGSSALRFGVPRSSFRPGDAEERGHADTGTTRQRRGASPAQRWIDSADHQQGTSTTTPLIVEIDETATIAFFERSCPGQGEARGSEPFEPRPLFEYRLQSDCFTERFRPGDVWSENFISGGYPTFGVSIDEIEQFTATQPISQTDPTEQPSPRRRHYDDDAAQAALEVIAVLTRLKRTWKSQATEAMASVANQTATQQLSLQKRYKEWRLAKKQHKLADRYKEKKEKDPKVMAEEEVTKEKAKDKEKDWEELEKAKEKVKVAGRMVKAEFDQEFEISEGDTDKGHEDVEKSFASQIGRRLTEEDQKDPQVPRQEKNPQLRQGRLLEEKLDEAMASAGSIESVLLLEREYKGKKRRQSWQSFEKKKQEKLPNPQCQMQKQNRGSASSMNWSRGRKLWRKKVQRSSVRSKKKKSVSERWKKQNEGPRSQGLSRLLKTAKESWFEKKAVELVESFVQNSAGQAKRTKETEDAYFKACRTLENSQSDFVDALQKVQDVAQRMQGEKIRKFFPLRNIVVEKHKDDENPFNRYFPAVCLCDYGSISSQIREANRKYVEQKRQHPDMFPEMEPPVEEQQEIPYAASKKMARPEPAPEAKPGQDATMEARAADLQEMQRQGPEVVNLEDESKVDESKKSDKQNIWTEAPPLPPGFWENRTQKEAQKEAFRKKYEEHSKQKLRETLERSLGKGSSGHSSGTAGQGETSEDKKGGESKAEAKERKADPGPDEAGSDPSTSEESESSEECDDPPVQVQPTDMEEIAEPKFTDAFKNLEQLDGERVEDNRQSRSIVWRIKEKDGGKVNPRAKEKERKDMAKPLEHSVLCKQEEDLGSDEEEEKVKAVDKVEEKEKARKEEKERKAKEEVKDLEPITNPFYGRLPNLGFTDSEEELERISAEEQNHGAQHYLTVSSMVMVSPDGKAKVPDDLTELLDSTPNGKWARNNVCGSQGSLSWMEVEDYNAWRRRK
ncbi:hypothetical protein AK812_SmicGene9685 [Symbiodinium microadriaticum]|uniref:Uncharacterized protein n=1 Tax=Symbiodinium microadriaticum TaxID=2951 RepID=A0A1Q9EHW5_SYMMI|nr:hypothetical protein AK812_SmicGene9685 [Symbiodinium microadriaticum]